MLAVLIFTGSMSTSLVFFSAIIFIFISILSILISQCNSFNGGWLVNLFAKDKIQEVVYNLKRGLKLFKIILKVSITLTVVCTIIFIVLYRKTL